MKFVTASDRRSSKPSSCSPASKASSGPESSHAVAHAIRLSRENPKHARSILVNLSGRGDKDMDYVIEHYGFGQDFHL